MTRVGSRKVTSLAGVAVLLAGLSTVVLTVVAPAALAAPLTVSPIASRPSGAVTADALPTVQIDGVVWSQAIVGNTVYAGGSFANARPAGAAVGTGNVPRANLLSYDIRTGVLNTSFAPSLNSTVRAVTASPDGSRIYVGGAFTTANGFARSRIAAYSTSTGALITTFKPAMGTQVNAIVATNSTVYVGGAFTSAAGVARNRLAAFNASNGSLTSWNPNADTTVNAMVLTPDGSRVIVGGSFQHVGGLSEYGLAAVDATSGAVLPWAANQSVQDAGPSAAIESLRTDGTSIFGTGYVFGPGGNLEGAFSADPNTGNVNWVESCHGDSYDSYPSAAGVVYVVSHAHFCGDNGGFQQSDTPWVTHRSTAFTTAATGTLLHNFMGGRYRDWYGTPSPSLVNWLPDLVNGSFTGQGQAAWTITGNSEYVIEGGEFPFVNGKAQQGLVRFAVASLAPNAQGPMLSGTKFVPNLSVQSPASVRVAFQANWDRDDQTLTYKVYRDGNTATPVWTTTTNSQTWNRPMLGFTDTGLTPGSTYSYQVWASDPTGKTAKGASVSIAVPASVPAQYAYAQQMKSDGASPYWPTDETGGTSFNDHAGYDDALVTGTVTRGVSGPILGTTATQFDGSTGAAYGERTSVLGPDVFSLEAWFKTTTTAGGAIIDFGSAQTGLSQNYDRNIYMDNTGHIYYGVQRTGTKRTVHSLSAFNNGAWHQVVATLSSAGMVLYVDGAKVAADPTTTTGQALFPGYWRVGRDNLSGWTAAPTSTYFAGAIGQVSVFPTALTAAQVTTHYGLRSSTNTPPTASFTQSCAALTCSFDGTGSSDPDGSVVSYAWKFGDGATSTSASPSYTYGGPGSYAVTLTVTDNQGAPGTTTNTVVVSPPNTPPTAAFTSSTSNLTASFDGSTSSDSDGSIAGYAWDFGDTSTGTGVTTSHPYAAAGTYTVTLTVTDNQGATGAVSNQVTVTAPVNAPPTAAFTSSTSNLTASFNGSTSSDPEGPIAGYAWDFGDSSTGTGVTTSHPYASAGTYTVTLTVTDNQGATGAVSNQVTVTDPVNAPPTAAFTSSTSNLTASFNGSTSSDPEGPIAGYAWDFGDSSTGTGVTTSHPYASAGTYTVTLTVTDNQGATGTVNHAVSVSTVTQYARDLFQRTLTGSWGSADLGGAWTMAGGAANFSVASGVGTVTQATPGSGPGAYLNTLALGDTNSTIDVALNKAATGGGDYLYLIARHNGSSDYRLRAKVLATGVVQASLSKTVGGTETVLTTVTVAGVTYTAGMKLHLRLQVSGTTSVSLTGKVWADGASEPAAWQVTATDSTSPLAAGAVGILTFLSSSSTNAPVAVAWSNLAVGPTGP